MTTHDNPSPISTEEQILKGIFFDLYGPISTVTGFAEMMSESPGCYNHPDDPEQQVFQAFLRSAKLLRVLFDECRTTYQEYLSQKHKGQA